MNSNDEAQIANQLVSRIIEGDTQAEHELIVRYQRGLFFILRKRCNNNEHLAKDMVQETWAIVLAKIRKGAIREPSKLAAFIIQTGKNLVTAHYRKASNKQNNFISEDDSPQMVDQSDTPEEVLQRYNLSLVVKQLIQELEQPRDRELLYRYFIKEQEKSLLCHELKLDTNHFDKVLYRAKRRFRQLYEKHDDSS